MLLGLLGGIALHNAFAFGSLGGYDAEEYIEHARSLIENGDFSPTRSYYTPPLFFAIAGVLLRLGDDLELQEPEHLGQLVGAVSIVGMGLLVLALCTVLFPGRPWLRVSALGLFVCCPLVLRSGAMFHPQPLAALLTTVALFVTARMLVRSSYGWQWAAGLGLVIGLAQLVRSVGLWALAVAALSLVAVALARADVRRHAVRALLIAAVVGIAVPAPWYAYLQTHHGSAVFGRAAPGEASLAPSGVRFLASADSAPPPIPADAWFFVSPGLPQSLTQPWRGATAPAFVPILYDDTWGDYFGRWSWGIPSLEAQPPNGDRLVTQTFIGLAPTFLVVAGWIGLATLAALSLRRRPELLPVALMPPVAVAGIGYYAHRFTSSDGDTVKGIFLLPAVPALAVAFGFAVDGVAARLPRPLCIGGAAALTIGGAILLEFAVA